MVKTRLGLGFGRKFDCLREAPGFVGSPLAPQPAFQGSAQGAKEEESESLMWSGIRQH